MLNIKKDFPWFNNNKGWVYADSAATSLKPKSVINCINNYYAKQCTSPHNNDSILAYRLKQDISLCRQKVADFLSTSVEHIVFTSGATESLNLIAFNLINKVKKGDEIIVTYGEHTSNFLPWLNIAQKKKCKLVIVGEKNKFNDIEQQILKSINKNTKIVSFANVNNLIGYSVNTTIVSKIKKINPNIVVVCDATQGLCHQTIDLSSTPIDFLVASGHKLLAGTGVGLLYISSKQINNFLPFKLGGGMNSDVSPSSFSYAPGVDKFEGGTANVAGILSWGAAIDYFNKIKLTNVRQHLYELANYLTKSFKQLNNVIVYKYNATVPIIAFNIKGIPAHDLANYLGANKVIVRSGLSCDKVINNVIDSEAVVRASFYIYNDKKDIDTLCNLLKKASKEEIIKYVIR